MTPHTFLWRKEVAEDYERTPDSIVWTRGLVPVSEEGFFTLSPQRSTKAWRQLPRLQETFVPTAAPTT